jgi:ubiquinone/menaquinone biosynthesis C-methylase UbiE
MNDYRSKVQVNPTHYNGLHYDNKVRWISYWYQINEIIKLEPRNVLEIGIGNGIVSKYLANHGVDITTMDIDERLKPDEVGSILDIPFSCNRFDVIGCFEVLEHVPYPKFDKALKELKRVTNEFVILSVPDITRVYRFNLELPTNYEIKKLITLPRLKRPNHEFDGEHYWEIGKKGYSLNTVIEDMKRVGFEVLNTFRLFEKTNHRFFILQTK